MFVNSAVSIGAYLHFRMGACVGAIIALDVVRPEPRTAHGPSASGAEVFDATTKTIPAIPRGNVDRLVSSLDRGRSCAKDQRQKRLATLSKLRLLLM